MKESTKCRSGLDRDRAVLSLPSRHGGKTPHTFSNDERVAAEYDGDVMVPARKRAAFEVIQAELALEFLVRAPGPTRQVSLRNAPRPSLTPRSWALSGAP